MEQLGGVLIQALISILSVALTIAANSFRKWIEAKAGLDGVRTVEIVAKNAVQAVEQIFKDKDIHGKRKFEKAQEIALDSLRANGINVSLAELNVAIESAVKSMNDGWKGHE